MRLIDLDALFALMNERKLKTASRAVLNEMPVIKTDVKVGRWERFGASFLKCSNCNHFAEPKYIGRFCPCCGSKNRGDDE